MDFSNNPYGASGLPPGESEAVGSPGTAKTFGVLNLIFSVVLFLCGLGYSLMVVGMSLMPRSMDEVKAAQQRQLDRLEDSEKNASTDADRKRIARERHQLEKAQHQMDTMPDFRKMLSANSPVVKGYYAGDVLTGLLCNVLMFVSGIGLLGLKNWGRMLALATAATKLVRVVALYAVAFPLVVAPVMAQGMTEAMEEFAREHPEEAGPNLAGRADTIAAGFAFNSFLFCGASAVYPLLSLVMLSRRGVKVACGGDSSEPTMI